MSQNCIRKDTESQTSKVSTTQELLSLFECPVCYEYILPPIHQCSQGHLICSICKPKVIQCPTCREELGTIRCLVMEKVAETLLFPCRYASQGCSVMLHRSHKILHEKKHCAYKLFECPYRFIENCPEWGGCRDTVRNHLMTTHGDNFRKEHGLLEPLYGSRVSLTPFVDVLDYNAVANTTAWMWTYVQLCFDHTFILNLYYIYNGRGNVHFATVRLVDTISTARQFRYHITLDGPQGQLGYTGACHSLHEDIRDIYESRDCLSFDANTALRFRIRANGARRQVLQLIVELMKLEKDIENSNLEIIPFKDT